MHKKSAKNLFGSEPAKAVYDGRDAFMKGALEAVSAAFALDAASF